MGHKRKPRTVASPQVSAPVGRNNRVAANVTEQRSHALEKNINYYLPGIIFLGSLIFLFFSLFKGFGGSIVDIHGFRQTQTAITVKYLLKGGPWLAYETPVLGPPWSIPFEFPLYQWLVELTAKTGIFQIDQAGRFVSIAFFLSTLYPFYRILKTLRLTTNQILLVLALYCLSPEYLFWSRTFMIESTALALAIYYLWFITLYTPADYSLQKQYRLLLGIAVVGALAATVKVTTFFAFGAGGLIFFAWKWTKTDKGKDRWKRDSLFMWLKFIFFAFLIPLIALILWTSFSDSLKSMNPLGRELTSSALKDWNFGTLSQRLSKDTWTLFFERTITDLIGSSWLLVVAVVAGLFCNKDRRIIVFVLLLLFIIPLVTFTNLYFIHNYYAYSNGVFLIAAVGVICSDLLESKSNLRRTAGGLLICSVIIFSVHHYLTSYYPFQGMTVDPSAVKEELDLVTKDSDIIVAFGFDWSSEVPYYLERRAVMFPANDLKAPSFQETKHNLQAYRIGAIIFSNNAGLSEEFVQNVLSEFGFGSRYSHNFGAMTIYYNPHSSPS